jgi:hypothetical protein
MATGVAQAEPAYADGGVDPTSKSNMGTSIFKINRDPVATNDYQDQGLDSGLYY